MSTPSTGELTNSMEDYLETIYDLECQNIVPRVRDIASRMNVTMPSVTGALKVLQDKGLVTHERYGHVGLTPAGRRVGQQVRRRHTALVAFLSEILDLPPDEAEAEACHMEHAVSTKTLNRLLCLLEFIEKCPRGGRDWLAHLHGRWTQMQCELSCQECIKQIDIPATNPFAQDNYCCDMATLDQFEPGFMGEVVKVAGDGAIRRRITEMGVTPGSAIQIRRVAPLGDPIEVIVRGYHLSLRKREAASIHVRPLPTTGLPLRPRRARRGKGPGRGGKGRPTAI